MLRPATPASCDQGGLSNGWINSPRTRSSNDGTRLGCQPLTNILNEEHLAEVDSLCTEAGTTVRTLAFNKPIVFFCVPEGLQVQEDCFVTLISYVTRHNLKLTTPEVPPAPVPPASSQMVPVIARAGRHERRTPQTL